MKVKYAVVMLIFGIILSLIGSLFKVMHWPFGNSLLIIATFLEVVGGIILGYKLLKYSKIKDFLNS